MRRAAGAESAPVDPKMKLGRSTAWSTPDDATACSAAHLALEVRALRAWPGPERADEDDPADIGLAGRLDEIAGADAIMRSNAVGEPSSIATRCTIVRMPRAAVRSDAGSVTSPRTSSQSTPSRACAPRALRTIALTPHAGLGKLAHDVVTDEAACPGDEDHPLVREVLPVAARRRAALSLVLRAERPRAVRRLGRLGHLHERELPDLHRRIDRDRQVRDVRQLERHVTVEPGVDEARPSSG